MTRLGVAHSSLDVLDVVFLRFIVAGMVLLPVLVLHRSGGPGPLAVVLMVAGIGAPYMLVVGSGLSLAPVGLFAIVTPGTMIVFAAIGGAFFAGERLTAMQRYGIAAIVAGLAIAGFDHLRSATGAGIAIALFLVGGLLWAAYTVTTRVCAVGALRATALVSVISALTYSPVYFWFRGSALLSAPVGEIALQAFYQGVMVSIFALYFYSKAVSLLGSAPGAAFAALVPVLAVVEAALLLGEAPDAVLLGGLGIVTLGMAVSLLAPRAPPAPIASGPPLR